MIDNLIPAFFALFGGLFGAMATYICLVVPGLRRTNAEPPVITGFQTWTVRPGEDITLVPSPPGTEPCGDIRPIGVVVDGSGLVLVYVRPHCRSKS